METFIELLRDWQVLLIPLAVVIISQVLKVAIESRSEGFQWKHLNSYGGMPSSHTAASVSLAVIVGLTQGFDDPLFAVTAFVGAVFIRDASGIRWSLGKHGQVLNVIIHNLPDEQRAGLPKHLEERLGHKSSEVLAGAILGAVLTIVFYLLLRALDTPCGWC